MNLGTPLAVILSLLFLIPGFLWRKTNELLSPYTPTGKTGILECFTLSCVFYTIAIVPVVLLLTFLPPDLDIANAHTMSTHFVYVAFWLLLVFLGPIGAGILTSKVLVAARRFTALRRVGIALLHPAPTGWDYAFARNEKYWVRIETKDGKLLEGMFDSNSLASSRLEERDIFLETVYEWDDSSERYDPLVRNAGIWVNGAEMKSITFFVPEPDILSDGKTDEGMTKKKSGP